MILITIGRNKDNRYVIDDTQKRISGYHAEIKVCDDNSITLIDHSLNGTTVNGKKIEKEVEVQINRGVEIIFGGFAKLDWSRIPMLPTIPPGTKLYSIGTHLTNRILINDGSNMVSRYHATLKIAPNGKMTISDHSANGTFVNGSRISPNQDVQVKRRDKILFANTQPLDWNKIPNSKTNPWLIISPIAAVLVVGLLVSAYVQGWPPFDKWSPKKIFAKYEKSVVVIRHEYKMVAEFIDSSELESKSSIVNGTAFFIDKEGTLLTNRHVTMPWEENIEDFKDFIIKNLLEKGYNSDYIKKIYGKTIYVGFALNGADVNRITDFVECSVLSQTTDDIKKDVGLMRSKNKQLPSPDINPIDINNAVIDPRKIKSQQEIFVMGYPYGENLFQGLSSGTTNTIQVGITNQSGEINHEPIGYLFGISASSMTHGASGSPVLNNKGQLIGIFNSSVEGGVDLKYAVLAKYAKELYDKAN
ncbi:MAG: FHA domain-containing protein [Prolixibacteraceae bacterium]|jgi:pSer/pThr/pTyr-binding forkhead associated (FHA) protein